MSPHKKIPFTRSVDGDVVPKQNLPAPDTKRWTISRKALIVNAIKDGVLGEEEALKVYNLSLDELQDWRQRLSEGGLKRLRVTKNQKKYTEQPSDNKRLLKVAQMVINEEITIDQAVARYPFVERYKLQNYIRKIK